jgi:Tol biopolymer transport system component
MTDRELEQRLRAWYAAEVGESEKAPEDLRASLATIPSTTPVPLRPLARRRGLTLLGIAAVLVVGGAVAAGAGLLRFNTVKPPLPSTAVLTTQPPSETPAETPASTPNLRPGGLIAFTRNVEKPERKCTSRFNPNCPTPRIWLVNTDGTGARELQEGSGVQVLVGWSPDGSRLLYTDEGKLFVADADGGKPRPADTGCATPCAADTQASLSRDGRQLVFVRQSLDADGYVGPSAIATMDLESGRVATLNPTSPDGGAAPKWSPDGSRILFYVYGEKDSGGPVPPRLAALWLIDRDGQNLRQASPPELAAQDADWSPDGARIVFVSPNPPGPIDNIAEADIGDIYTMRPDGSDVRRLTTDRTSKSPTWTADGRILYVRVASGAASGTAGWWTMNADGTGAERLASPASIGVTADDLGFTDPVWQPLGGSAIVATPWGPPSQVAVGPPAPTPVPTVTPDLGPGFSWTGTTAMQEDSPLGETATLLADGWVLITAGCSTAAELYDPATGTFHGTGAMTAVRGGKTATRLRDGRVLITGGYNCAKAGEDGVWASAELYDPTTGTFSRTGSMRTPREFHTATLLADGRVLIAGGYTANRPPTGSLVKLASYPLAESAASVLKSAEIYDPATGTFSRTGPMSTFRDHHTATLLNDGRVLVVGGGGEGYASSTSADVYDPSTGTFTKTGSMKQGRWLHTATLLGDGRVLVLGGRSPKDSVYKSAEIYDPDTGRFSPAGTMGEGRQQHTATRLPDGRVLITAGYWSDGQKWRVLTSAEMFDPATGKFGPIGSIGTPREGHNAVLLDDGRVLIVGGEDIGREGGVGVSSAVLYQP